MWQRIWGCNSIGLVGSGRHVSSENPALQDVTEVVGRLKALVGRKMKRKNEFKERKMRLEGNQFESPMYTRKHARVQRIRSSTRDKHSSPEEGEPFACTVPGCDYRSKEKSNLTGHLRTHTGERPFACTVPGCDYRSKRKSTLTTHLRTHTGARPFVCTVPGCDYRSKTKGHLTRHLRTHTGERPFACTVPGCDYRSNQKGALTQHLRTHTGERPFACTVPGCDYRSKQKSHLKTHLRTHTGD